MQILGRRWAHASVLPMPGFHAPMRMLLALMAAAILAACAGESTPPEAATEPEDSLRQVAQPAVTPEPESGEDASVDESTGSSEVDPAALGLGLPRFGHEAILLNSGDVLVSGGYTGIANNNVIAPQPIGLLQRYNRDTGVWSHIGPVEGPGILYSSVKLADGRVLFVGLRADAVGPESMVSVFDPATESWRPVPGPSVPRWQPHLVLLDDGTVLVAGGVDVSDPSSFSVDFLLDVEIYDPSTESWREAAGMTAASEDQWLFALNDGRAIAVTAPDVRESGAVTYVEVYDPATDAWTPIDSADPYYAPTGAVQLADGRLLVLGELGENDGYAMDSDGRIIGATLPDGREYYGERFKEQFPDAKVYDPMTDTWSAANGMAAQREHVSLTLLSDGRVLAAGGEEPDDYDYVLLSTTDIFDPSTGSWSPGPDLAESRSRHTATLLSDGAVLLVGGTAINRENEERYPTWTTEIVRP